MFKINYVYNYYNNYIYIKVTTCLLKKKMIYIEYLKN